MHHHMRNPGFFRNMTNLSKLALLIAAVLSLCVLPLDTAAQEARATLGGRVKFLYSLRHAGEPTVFAATR
jgi:hypothetical protein